MTPEHSPILSAQDVSKTYRQRKHDVHALSNVSVSVRRGDTVGLIGESGSGKTTLTRLLLGLEQPTSGQVRFAGTPLPELTEAQTRTYRSAVAAVFQNPFSSLNPRRRVWEAITEQLAISRADEDVRRARANELLEVVGFPAATAERYPHQLSGGQRQRIAVARALAADPQLIVLDEPLSALDVSVRAQIVNLLLDLQDAMGLAYLFVGHDLAIAHYMCHHVLVMRHGSVVEEGEADTVLRAPSDPYTAALVEASYVERADLEPAGPRLADSSPGR